MMKSLGGLLSPQVDLTSVKNEFLPIELSPPTTRLKIL